MLELINIVNEKVSKFNLEDWAIFKGLILIVGALIGCTFAETCKKLRPLLVIIWVALFTYLFLKMFILNKELN